MGNTQQKQHSKMVTSVSMPPTSNKTVNQNMKPSKSATLNVISNQHQNYDIKKGKSSLRKRLLTTFGLKSMKNSQTSQLGPMLKQNTAIIHQRSTTDPDFLVIESHNQPDMIDLEKENQFLIDVNKKLQTLSQQADDTYSYTSNDSYVDEAPILNSKFSNLNRNFSKLSKSPAIFNINYYTHPAEAAVNTRVKDLLTEQQFNDDDEDFLSLKKAQSSTNNRQKSVSSACETISNSSMSSESNTSESSETLSQIFHYDTFYYIDDTITSTPTSSTRLKRFNPQLKSSRKPDFDKRQSAIPWFRFVNAVNRQLHMCRQPKPIKRDTFKHLNSNKRPPLEAVDNYYYDEVTIKKIINKEVNYDFNDNNSSLCVDYNDQGSNICLFTMKSREAPIATLERMTPLSLSNDYLNKLEFLKSKKSFINNENSHVEIKRFSCLV